MKHLLPLKFIDERKKELYLKDKKQISDRKFISFDGDSENLAVTEYFQHHKIASLTDHYFKNSKSKSQSKDSKLINSYSTSKSNFKIKDSNLLKRSSYILQTDFNENEKNSIVKNFVNIKIGKFTERENLRGKVNIKSSDISYLQDNKLTKPLHSLHLSEMLYLLFPEEKIKNNDLISHNKFNEKNDFGYQQSNQDRIYNFGELKNSLDPKLKGIWQKYSDSLKSCIPNYLKEAPPGREESNALDKWLTSTSMEIFKNQDLNENQKILHLDQIIHLGIQEVFNQVKINCKERGNLLYKLINVYEKLFKQFCSDEKKVKYNGISVKEKEIETLKMKIEKINSRHHEEIIQREKEIISLKAENTLLSSNLKQYIENYKGILVKYEGINLIHSNLKAMYMKLKKEKNKFQEKLQFYQQENEKLFSNRSSIAESEIDFDIIQDDLNEYQKDAAEELDNAVIFNYIEQVEKEYANVLIQCNYKDFIVCTDATTQSNLNLIDIFYDPVLIDQNLTDEAIHDLKLKKELNTLTDENNEMDYKFKKREAKVSLMNLLGKFKNIIKRREAKDFKKQDSQLMKRNTWLDLMEKGINNENSSESDSKDSESSYNYENNQNSPTISNKKTLSNNKNFDNPREKPRRTSITSQFRLRNSEASNFSVNIVDLDESSDIQANDENSFESQKKSRESNFINLKSNSKLLRTSTVLMGKSKSRLSFNHIPITNSKKGDVVESIKESRNEESFIEKTRFQQTKSKSTRKNINKSQLLSKPLNSKFNLDDKNKKQKLATVESQDETSVLNEDLMNVLTILDMETKKTGKLREKNKDLQLYTEELIKHIRSLMLTIKKMDKTKNLDEIRKRIILIKNCIVERQTDNANHNNEKGLQLKQKAGFSLLTLTCVPSLLTIKMPFMDQFNNNALQIIKRVQSTITPKDNRLFIPPKNLVKIISHIYDDKISAGLENPYMRDIELSIFVYNQFLNRYGFKKVAEKKFMALAYSCKKYNEIMRINMFSRLLGIMDDRINYSVDEARKYFEGIDYLLNNCNLGIPLPNSDGDSKRLVPYLRCFELIRVMVEGRINSEEINEIRKEFEKLKEPDPKGSNKYGMIDIDLTLMRLLDKYRIIMIKTKGYVINAFKAADLDGNKICNYLEFVLLFRHIEKDAYNDDLVVKIFDENADIIHSKSKSLSFDKFASIALEFNLFKEEKQNSFIGIAQDIEAEALGLYYIEEIEKWNFKKEDIEQRFEILKPAMEDNLYPQWINFFQNLDSKIKESSEDYYKAILIAIKIIELELLRLENIKEVFLKEMEENQLVEENQI